MKHLLYLCIVLLCTACGKEAPLSPNVWVEIACIATNSKGTPAYFIKDDGSRYTIAEIQKKQDIHTADSTYRVHCSYTKTGEDSIKVFAYALVTSPVPQPTSFFPNGIKTAPVHIEAIWKSGNYINMILYPMIKEQKHVFHFVEQQLTLQENNRKHLSFLLYHDNKEDTEAYRKKHVLSLPLSPYKSILKQGDTVSITIQTYKEGLSTYTFMY